VKKSFKETSGTGALAWLLQRISAVVLFVLLLFHFVTYHFITQGHSINYAQVMARATSWWFPLVQFVFLICALYHGLNGVWNVLEDYATNRNWRLFFYSVIWLGGIVLLFVGTLTIVKLATLKG
jgi:succinate dehydrogenase / fumarate reductase, membrane anchor subunit